MVHTLEPQMFSESYVIEFVLLSDLLKFLENFVFANRTVYSSRWGVALLRAILMFNHSSCHGIEILYLPEP